MPLCRIMIGARQTGKMRSPGEQAITEIDAAVKEFRRDEPAIDTVDKGLRAAKSAGVPVDLEGPKPPASALAVTVTGFGPGSIAPKKPVPAVSPLGKAEVVLGSEVASDERIGGMPKYVPRPAIDAFRPVAAASHRVDRATRQAALDTFSTNIRNGSFGVDHRGSLARHWNAVGHRSTAEVRARFASDPSNPVLVSGSWNSSKGGEGENYSNAPAAGFTRHLGETAAPPTTPAAPVVPSAGMLAPP